MAEIRYNNKTYGAISNNSRDIVYGNSTVKNELDKINSNLTNLQKKHLSPCFSSVAQAAAAYGSNFTSGSMWQFINTLPMNSCGIMFATKEDITNLPTKDAGLVQFFKGPSTTNLFYAIFFDLDGNIYFYKYHSDSTTGNNWHKVTLTTV